MAGNKKPGRKPTGVRIKLKTKTPVLIRYGDAIDKKFKTEPYIRLSEYKARNGTRDGWLSIAFRLMFGLEASQAHFNTEASVILSQANIVMVDVKERAERMGDKWGMSEEEIGLINSGLEVTDAMQDTTTKKEQLVIYAKIDKLFNRV